MENKNWLNMLHVLLLFEVKKMCVESFRKS